MSPVEEILEALQSVTKSGEGWAAFCPAHKDTKTRHLTISEAEDGRVLAHCHKGCSFLEIMHSLGMEPKDAFPRPVRDGRRRQYHVRDHAGRVVAIHHRDDSKEKKTYWWSTPDGKNGLGNLKGDSLPLWGTEAISSVSQETQIILCEGEKSASGLNYRGVPAVATVTGASGTPSKETLSVLKGRHVVLWPDNDEEGIKHMRRVGKSLLSIGCEVRWYEWDDAPDKGDAADHPAVLRGNVEALRETLASAPRFRAPHDPATDGAATFGYVSQTFRNLLDLRLKQGGITGIKTGIPKIDAGTHGLNRGYSYIVAARPNVGKSLLAGQIALTAALRGHRVLLQTPEMSAVQYLERFACYIAEVDYFRTQDGEIAQVEYEQLNATADFIDRLPILVDEYGTQPIERIRQNIERHEPDLLVVDYLQYLAADDRKSNRTQQVGQISRDLSTLKSDYNIPVVVAAQLNRGIEHRDKESEPQLSDLRDSGELEQDADVVMFIHRPDRNSPDVEPEDEEIRILCRKNRMGTLWHTTVRFVKGQQWFSDHLGPVRYEGTGS